MFISYFFGIDKIDIALLVVSFFLLFCIFVLQMVIFHPSRHSGHSFGFHFYGFGFIDIRFDIFYLNFRVRFFLFFIVIWFGEATIVDVEVVNIELFFWENEFGHFEIGHFRANCWFGG